MGGVFLCTLLEILSDRALITVSCEFFWERSTLVIQVGSCTVMLNTEHSRPPTLWDLFPNLNGRSFW